jgi:hypothetical protein
MLAALREQIRYAELDWSRSLLALGCMLIACLAVGGACAIYTSPGAGLRHLNGSRFELSRLTPVKSGTSAPLPVPHANPVPASLTQARVEQVAPASIGASGNSAAARPPLRPKRSRGDRALLKVSSYGCPDPEDAAKITALILNKEFVAGIQTALRAKCRLLNAGPMEVIMSSTRSGELYCVRPDSEDECLWVSDAWLV